MDNILQILMSWQFIIFSLGIVAITSIFRTLIEYLLANVKIMTNESKLWKDLILPVFPVVLGLVAGIVMKEYPYPTGISSRDSRIIFGLVAGLLSTLIYRIVKALFNQKLAAALPPGTVVSEDPTADALVKRVSDTINKE